jgi:diaminopimelate epimerase
MAGTGLPFLKLEGAGNDYLFFDAEALGRERAQWLRGAAPRLAPRWCHRHFGVGGDGLVLFGPEGAVDARLEMWNADGSRGRLCGNALRCVGRLLAERQPGRDGFLLASDAGAHRARVERPAGLEPSVRIELAAPRFELEQIPVDPSQLELLAPPDGGPARVRLSAARGTWEGLVLSVGNPHLILPLAEPPLGFPVGRLGAELERHPAFPERINVGFLHLAEDGRIRLRTFERGSGETLACGSNAVAAVVALCSLGAWPRGREARLEMPGGVLEASWSQTGSLWLGGPTRRVFAGELDRQAAEDFAAEDLAAGDLVGTVAPS